MKRLFLGITWIVVVVGVLFWIFALNPTRPKSFTYGVSFSRFHSDELHLDWKKVYLAVLDDLKVRNFRFSAHWPLTEPARDQFNFQELDFQMHEAENRKAQVILAVGRRLPGWPECHIPDWAKNLSNDELQARILKYIDIVVRRYRDSSALEYWQVENEPYLTLFSKQACGGNLDEEFLKKEINLVRSLDPGRPILLTDSGELSTWYSPYKNSDVFGTSIYLYIWNRTIGQLRYPIGPWFFQAKRNLMKLLVGDKPSLVIELSAEPWLLNPIVDTPVDVQLSQMNKDRFNEILDFSKQTGFDRFYLWGVEWWYWMKENQNHPEFWDTARGVF